MPPNRRDFCIFVKMRGLRIFVKDRVDEYCIFVKPKYDSTEHFFLVTLSDAKRTGGEIETVNEIVNKPVK